MLDQRARQIYDRVAEDIHENTTAKIMDDANFPTGKQDLVYILNDIRSHVISEFNELLTLTNSKEERERIVLKV